MIQLLINMTFALILRPDRMRPVTHTQVLLGAFCQFLFLGSLPGLFSYSYLSFVLLSVVVAYLGALCVNFIGNRPLRWMLAPICLGLTLLVPLVVISMEEPVWISVVIMAYPIIFILAANSLTKQLEAHAKQSKVVDEISLGNFDEKVPLTVKIDGALHAFSEVDDEVLRLMREALPTEWGEVVGSYQGEPIYAWVKTKNGMVYEFDCVLHKGQATGMTASGCIVLPPNLLYRLNDSKTS